MSSRQHRKRISGLSLDYVFLRQFPRFDREVSNLNVSMTVSDRMLYFKQDGEVLM